MVCVNVVLWFVFSSEANTNNSTPHEKSSLPHHGVTQNFIVLALTLPFIMSPSFLFLSLVLWSLLDPAWCNRPSSLRAYNCSSEPYDTLSLLEVGACIRESNATSVSRPSVSVVTLSTSKTVRLPRCRLSVLLTEWHCGMHSHISIVSPQTAADLPMTAALCYEMHTTRIWVYRSLSIVLKLGKNQGTATIGGSFKRDGSCTSEKGGSIMQVQYEIFLTQEDVIYSIPDKSLTLLGVVLSLEDSCDAELGCLSIRDLPLPTCNAGDLRLVYSGPAEEYQVGERTLVLVSGDQQGAFELKERTVICNLPLSRTNEQALFYTTDLARPLESATPMSLPLYLSSQLSFMHYHSAANRHQTALAFSHALCELERSMLKNRLAILRREPDIISHDEYTDLMGKGISALRAGEVLYLFRCEEVEVTARSTPTTCYEFLPISVGDKPMFMEPFTHIISETSPSIPCFTPFRPLYHINGAWYDVHTKSAAASPRTLNPAQPVRVELAREYRPNGLMTKESYQAFRDSLQNPSRRKAATNLFADVAYNPGTDPLSRAEYADALGNLRRGMAEVASVLEKIGAWTGFCGLVLFVLTVIHRIVTKYAMWRILRTAGATVAERLRAIFFPDAFITQHVTRVAKAASRETASLVCPSAPHEQKMYPSIGEPVTLAELRARAARAGTPPTIGL